MLQLNNERQSVSSSAAPTPSWQMNDPNPANAAELEQQLREHVRTVTSRLRVGLPQVAARQDAYLQSIATGVTTHPGARNGAGSIEERFLQRTTFGWNVGLQEQVNARGWKVVLEQQLDPDGIDDLGLEQLLLDALPTLSMTPLERLLAYQDNRVVPLVEIAFAVFIRALYSPRQLFERTVELWNDHLHTALEADLGVFFKADYDRDVRSNALRTFRRLLGASARGPAMLDYLTNNTNVKQFPNENYARELMELHTLGVDAGYTQNDVREVARAFTGWTFFDERDPFNTFGRFTFLRRDHDVEPKTVLGHSLAAGRGLEDGEQVLDILAGHSNTARFVARKMLVHFWGEHPSERQIEEIAEVYETTGGDLRALIRQTLSWYNLTTAAPKLKRPLHLAVSALRALFAAVDDAAGPLIWLFSAGHFPFFWGPPNGYPDSEGYWSGAPLERWNFSNAVLVSDPGIRIEIPVLEQAQTPEQLIGLLDALLLGGSMEERTRQGLLQFLAQIQHPFPLSAATQRELIGLATAAPEFQYY